MPSRKAYVGRLHTFRNEDEHQQSPPAPEQPAPEKSASSAPYWIWGGLSALFIGLVGGLGTYAWRKRRKKRKQAIALASQKQPMLPGRVRIPVAHQRVVRRQSWESISSDETVHDNVGMTTTLEGGHPYFTENSRYTLTGDRACGCLADDDVKVTVKITPGEEGGLQVSPDLL